MRRPASSGASARQVWRSCLIEAKVSFAPSHSTSPRQHSSLPTNSAGKRYMMKTGMPSVQRPKITHERLSR